MITTAMPTNQGKTNRIRIPMVNNYVRTTKVKVLVDLAEDGVYFVRTIYMTTVPDNDELTHRSKWATLTFEVSHKHGAETHRHDHDHDHDHEHSLPTLGLCIR